MFHFYSLFMLIYLLLHAYKDFCLTVFCWLITFHKSIPVLEIDPSKVIVKFLKCRPWYSIVTPFFPLLGGFKDPEGSVHFNSKTVLFNKFCHFVLLLIKRYNSCRVLAFSMIFFHSRQSWASSDHLVIFIFLNVRHSHNLKFPTVLLLVEYNTTLTLAILMECDSVAVGVRTEGMKLLKMVSIKIIVL